jgi:hypothetical protein
VRNRSGQERKLCGLGVKSYLALDSIARENLRVIHQTYHPRLILYPVSLLPLLYLLCIVFPVLHPQSYPVNHAHPLTQISYTIRNWPFSLLLSCSHPRLTLNSSLSTSLCKPYTHLLSERYLRTIEKHSAVPDAGPDLETRYTYKEKSPQYPDHSR